MAAEQAAEARPAETENRQQEGPTGPADAAETSSALRFRCQDDDSPAGYRICWRL